MKLGKTMLNPRAISQIPNKGGIVAVADWGTEPLTLDVIWGHTHKSISPYLSDVIAEKEDNTVLLRSSLWAESLIANEKWGRARKSIISYFQRHEILERFEVIAQREDNWDGYESKSPNKLSLDHARQFMREFFDVVVSEELSWLTPLISSDEDGYITVAWHGEGRQLHLQIEENEVDYIQVWGPNIDTEMHVDTLYSKDYLMFWKWLLYG